MYPISEGRGGEKGRIVAYSAAYSAANYRGIKSTFNFKENGKDAYSDHGFNRTVVPRPDKTQSSLKLGIGTITDGESVIELIRILHDLRDSEW